MNIGIDHVRLTVTREKILQNLILVFVENKKWLKGKQIFYQARIMLDYTLNCKQYNFG